MKFADQFLMTVQVKLSLAKFSASLKTLKTLSVKSPIKYLICSQAAQIVLPEKKMGKKIFSLSMKLMSSSMKNILGNCILHQFSTELQTSKNFYITFGVSDKKLKL
jgi:hypothetical protein